MKFYVEMRYSIYCTVLYCKEMKVAVLARSGVDEEWSWSIFLYADNNWGKPGTLARVYN